ncbi:MAG: hypothetical protein KJN79_01195, partial [Gammaproteobacteria bacterium]|nr:hypothetical protein [Gammaproteobacteria bacterium]
MAPTSIFFQGRLITTPGAYTEIDPSGLEVVGLTASGIVAAIGEAKGGKPWNAVDASEVRNELQVATNPQQPFRYFRSGDLREVAPILFGPADDPDIPAGAQEVVFVKTNPATQSTAQFDKGADAALDVTSLDYGHHTTQINLEIGTGTNKGKIITVVFEATTETFDDVGGDSRMTITYLSTTPADGFQAVTAEVTAGELLAAFTISGRAGLDGDVTNQVTATQVIECVSDNAADVGVIIEIFGTDTSDAAQRERVTLNGTTAVDTTATWNSFHGARVVSGTLAGTATLQNDAGGTAITTLTSVVLTQGLEPLVDCPVGVSSVIKIVMDGTTDFVAGDIGKVIQADGSNIGALVDYSNDDPVAGSGIAWVRDTNDHGQVADNQAITTVAGTGAGTASAASTVTSWLDFEASGASTARVGVVGLNTAGTLQYEVVQLDGTNPVVGTAAWSKIDYLALGELAAATTLTARGNAINAGFTGFNTFQKLADKVNGSSGFTLALLTGETALDPANLDVAAAVSCLSPAIPDFYANLYDVVQILELESALVSAAAASGATGVPDNTAAPVYLAGGHEGSSTPGQEAVPTSTYADWQGAIDLLTKMRVNTLWLGTATPAVHAYAKAHCAYMAGIGRSERDCKVGLMNTAGTGLPTKAEIKSQLLNLNTRHVQGWAQNIERYNTSGDAEVLDPMFGAAVLAGMQAGTDPGTPQTKRVMNTLSLAQDATWNPADDSEEMIKAGLCFGEVSEVGRRVVRGVTTHLSTSNIAFVESSVNDAVNYSVFNYRSAMEAAVGKAGFAGTIGAARADALNILGLLVGISLTAWRSLQFDLILDVLENSLEISPVLPVNFVKTTVHLVSIPQTAST